MNEMKINQNQQLYEVKHIDNDSPIELKPIHLIPLNRNVNKNKTHHLFYDTASNKLIQIINDRFLILDSKGIIMKEMKITFIK